MFVCVCVCMVTDFSTDDKASGVKFCAAVYSAYKAGNLPIWGTLLSQKLPRSL